MIQFKKQIILLLVSVLLIGTSSLSLNAQRQNLERIKAERVAFFTEQLELSSDEAEKFWPLYNDYSNRRDKLNEESRMLIRFVGNNMENMDEAEIDEQLNKYIEIQNKSHKLFLDYNEKFLQVLPASKVIKLYIAESKFKQWLIKRISDARQQREGNRRF